MGQETMMNQSRNVQAGLVGIRKNNHLMHPSSYKDGADKALADDGDGGDNSQLGVPSVAGGNGGVQVGRGNVHIVESPRIMYPGIGDKLDHALAAVISIGRGDTFVPSSSVLYSLLSPANNESHGEGLLKKCLSVEGDAAVDFAIVISRNSGKAQQGSNTTTTSAAPVAASASGRGVHAPEPEAPSPAPFVEDDARPAGAAAHGDSAAIHDDGGDGPALHEEEDTSVSQGTCAGHIADASSPGSTLEGGFRGWWGGGTQVSSVHKK